MSNMIRVTVGSDNERVTKLEAESEMVFVAYRNMETGGTGTLLEDMIPEGEEFVRRRKDAVVNLVAAIAQSLALAGIPPEIILIATMQGLDAALEQNEVDPDAN